MGAHMLATGPAGVEVRFVREIMLLLDGISVGGTKHKRERGFTPVLSVTKLSSLCKCLASTKFGRTVAMCLSERVVARSSRPTKHQQMQEACVWQASPQEELLQLLHVGQGGEDRKTRVLGILSKRTDIPYHLN